ncbi:MAG: ribulose-phosphate 3-epimerase [Porcipelethomonas sp.]
MKNTVSVSILSADFMHLEEDIRRIEKSGARMLHFDVMDGVFVNNISFGFPVLKAVNAHTDMHLDVHLMITDPLRYIDECRNCGADTITFHLESSSNANETIKAIKKTGAKTGLSLKPGTPFEEALPYMDKIDMLLIMTVEPGFGGQSFMEDMLDKISKAKKYISENNLSVSIEVDGGINDKTALLCSRAGADIMVAGSYIFKSSDMNSAVSSLTDAK